MSLDVAEHIPTAQEHAYLANLNCSVGLGLVLSWAPPGQLGAGHVNLREQHDVVARLAAFGLVVDVGVSAPSAGSCCLPVAHEWLRASAIVAVANATSALTTAVSSSSCTGASLNGPLSQVSESSACSAVGWPRMLLGAVKGVRATCAGEGQAAQSCEDRRA